MRTRRTALVLTVGTNIAAVRAKRGWTQATLAEAVGIDARSISRIERGSASASLPRLEAIADALGIPVDALFKPDAAANPTMLGGVGEVERVWKRIPRARRELALDVLRAFAR